MYVYMYLYIYIYIYLYIYSISIYRYVDIYIYTQFEPWTTFFTDNVAATQAIVVQHSQFEIETVRVKTYILFSILHGCSAPVTCWCVPTKLVSQGLEQGTTPYSESKLVFFRIHANQRKYKFSVSRSGFDSRCKPGVSSSWMGWI